jgi:hypothetical protein
MVLSSHDEPLFWRVGVTDVGRHGRSRTGNMRGER